MKARAFIGRVAGKLLLVAAVLSFGYFAGVGASTLTLHSQQEALPQAIEGAAQEAGGQDPTGQGATDDDTSYQPKQVSHSDWNEDESPNYYRELGPAQVGEQPAAGTVRYGKLDGLGRATGAVTLATYDSMQAGIDRERGDTSDIHPSGWGHNGEVDMAMPDGTIYHGMLFNRSHLIAKSLGGAERIENLICGTRTQNVGANLDGHEGGMAYAEGLARAWLAQHKKGTLYYAATPAYEGDELVARSIIVDLRSSDGSLDKRVEVYNAARGFAIDYMTGEFHATEDAQDAAREIAGRSGTRGAQDVEENQAQADADGEVEVTGSPEAENGERKVIITGSGKAYHHDQSCKGLENAHSMEWVTIGEAEAMGRHPCGICGG